MPDSPLVDPQRDRIFAAFQPATIEVVAAPPPATLGWLAAAAFVATSLLGVWFLAASYESWSPAVLWRAIVDRNDEPILITRRLAHVLAGIALVILAAVIGVVGARSRASRAWPLIVGFVLLIVLVGQAWLGVLLLLDSNSGPITRFNG
jgi:hypothetical protein